MIIFVEVYNVRHLVKFSGAVANPFRYRSPPHVYKIPPPLHLHLPYLSLPLIIIFLLFYSCCTPGPLRHGMLRPLLLYLNLLIISSTDAPLLITLKISNYYFTPIAYNILTHLPWIALTSINIYCAMLPLCWLICNTARHYKGLNELLRTFHQVALGTQNFIVLLMHTLSAQ